MAERNLLLSLIISAKDNASSVVSSVFGFLDRTTSATANKIRDAFSNLFSGNVFSNASNFEESMARINAVMRPLPDEFQALRNKAEELGRSTRYTATEAANALEILAKAGFSSSQAIEALDPVLSLAQGASIGLADAAGYVSDSLTQFGLQADQSSRVVDVLSKAANSANMTVGDMGQAFKYVGGIAAQAGLSIEQTAAVLDVFAQAGLRSDMAGTALRDLLQDLNDPASAARESMFKLGVSTNNLFEAIDALRKAGPGATQAIQDFGIRSSGAMFTLVRAGTDGVKNFESAILGAKNYASESRKIMDDTFKGATYALTSAWEGLQIALETPILEPLKQAVKDISNEMNRFASSGIVQGIGKDIASVFDSSGKAIVGFIRSFNWEDIKAGAKSATSSISGYFTDAVNTIRGATQQISDLGTTAFSPITVAINGYRLALALANGDTEKAAEIQAKIEDQSAAIARALSGTSAEYARLGAAAKASGDQIQSSVKSQADLQEAQEAAQRKVTALTSAFADQDAKRAALDEANQRGVATLEEYAASVTKTWDLQRQLKSAQAELTAAQNALNAAQNAGAATSEQSAAQQKTAAVAAGQAATATQSAASATKNYSIEWTKAGEVTKSVAGNIEPVVAGYTNLSSVVGLATKGAKDWQTETERVNSSAKTLTATSAATSDGMEALKQKVLDANKALAEQKSAYEAAKTAGTLTGDSYQKLQQAQAAAQNALQNLTLVTAQQVDVEKKSALAATQTTAAVEAKNATSTREASALAAVAMASGNAYSAGKALEGIAVIALDNAQKSAAAKENEAKAYEGLAKAAANQYAASKLNTALSAETLSGLKSEAERTAQLAAEKRALAETSKATADQIQSETYSVQGVSRAIDSAIYSVDALNAANRRIIDSQIEQEKAAIRLANAVGDESAAEEHAAALKDLQIEKARAIAEEKQNEADAAQGVVDALIRQANADGVVTEAEATGIASAQKLVAAKQNEADAANTTADAIKKEADAKKESAAADAERASAGKAASKVMNDSIAALKSTGGEIEKLSKLFYELQGQTTSNANSWDAWATGTVRAVNEVKTAYENQKSAINGMIDALNQFNSTGEYNTQVQQAMIQAGGDLAAQYELMDKQHLDNLRAALDSANKKLRDMRQEAQSATDQLAELNAEIAAEQGDTAKSDRLKLQLEESQKLAAVEENLAKAQAENNAELIALYQSQVQKLKELYDLKSRNLEKDIQSKKEQAATSTTNTTTNATTKTVVGSGGASTSGGITLNINAGNAQLLDANFADALARQLKPRLDAISRRSA